MEEFLLTKEPLQRFYVTMATILLPLENMALRQTKKPQMQARLTDGQLEKVSIISTDS
ncbi:hypothetical protein D3C72_1137240 [compost metagenome]